MIEHSGLFILIVSCIIILIAGYKLISFDHSSIVIANKLMIEKNKFFTLVVSCIAIFIIGYNLFSYNNTFILLSLLIPIAHVADLKGHKSVFCIGASGYALSLLLLFALSFSSAFGHAWTSFLHQRVSPLFFYLVFMIRGLQDLFLAMMMPTSIALLIAAFPKKQRAMSLGLYFSVLGFSQLFSTPITLVIVGYLTIRGYYLIYILLAICAAALCHSAVNARPLQRQPIDWLGSICLICCLAFFSITLSMTTLYHQWTATSFLYGLISFIFLILFIAIEKQSKQPLLPWSICKNRELWAAIILYGCGSAVVSLLLILPMQLFSSLRLFNRLLLTLPLLIILPLLIGYCCNRKNRSLAIHISFILCLSSLLAIIIIITNVDNNLFSSFRGHDVVNLLLMITWLICTVTSLSLIFLNDDSPSKQPALFISIIITLGIICAQVVSIITTFSTYLFRYYENANHTSSVRLNITLSAIVLLIFVIAWLSCYLLMKKRR